MLTVLFLVFGFCFLPERRLPGWTVRVLAANFAQLGVVTLAGRRNYLLLQTPAGNDVKFD